MSISIKILGAITLPSVNEVQELDFCFCGVDCYDNYIEKAFTADSNSEDWKRDKSSFLFRRAIESDSVSIEIWKGGSKVADVLDNTFGTYYSTFSAQPLYVGFIADWSLVAGAFGNGIYTIRAVRTIFGQSTPFTSRKFQVLPYSEKFANGTVRIETYTQGNILSSEFDYQGLLEDGWFQSIRIGGRFGNENPTLIQDRILNSDRQVVSVQDSLEFDYTLFTDYLPENVKKQLTRAQSLTTRTLITDYNLLNDEVIRQKAVVQDSFDEAKHQERGTAYVIKYKNRNNNTLLRIF